MQSGFWNATVLCPMSAYYVYIRYIYVRAVNDLRFRWVRAFCDQISIAVSSLCMGHMQPNFFLTYFRFCDTQIWEIVTILDLVTCICHCLRRERICSEILDIYLFLPTHRFFILSTRLFKYFSDLASASILPNKWT